MAATAIVGNNQPSPIKYFTQEHKNRHNIDILEDEISRIFKKRKSRDLYLAENLWFLDQIRTLILSKYKYERLEFSKDGLTRCSSLYKTKERPKQHKDESTLIPEVTDNGDAEEGLKKYTSQKTENYGSTLSTKS